MRCGTTSLYFYLSRHPSILPPCTKEPFFFADEYARGFSWYRSLFPLTLAAEVARRRTGTRGITFEGSTYYLFHPLARNRIHAFDPAMKLIVLLRDPVERALSHYHHSLSKGRESLSFEDALAAEQARLAGEDERIVSNPGYRSFSHLHHSYATRGRYADSLQAWFELFPREQLLILAAEDLFVRPADVVSDVINFLGFSETDLSPYLPANTRAYDQMQANTRAELESYFAEPNRRLYSLIGREFDWAHPTSPQRTDGLGSPDGLPFDNGQLDTDSRGSTGTHG
jgi:sulfotransferase family protein